MQSRFNALIIAVLALGLVYGDTHTAASCSQAAVQAAMNAAGAGDTVAIPAGTGTWTGQVSWNAPANVTLKGAGSQSVVGGGNMTVIVDNFTAHSPLLVISVSAAGVFRMTGITVQGGSGGLKDGGVMQLHGPGTVRLDHLRLNSQSYNPSNNSKVLWVGDRIYGVLDHSILDLYSTSAVYIYNGSGPDGQGNTTWASETNFGGSNFFFMEDNQVNGTISSHDSRIVDGFSGARFVIRYNSFSASCISEVHATGHSPDDRGSRAQEVYGNVSTSPGMPEPNFCMVDVSSGTALVWGNTAVNVYKNIMIFNVTRKNNDTYNQSAAPNGWGYCGTDFDGTGSPWDQNSTTGTGYACLDQPGRGKGDLLTGTLPNKVNSTTGTRAWPRQALEPVYFWNNTASVASGWGGTWYSNNSETRSGPRVAADRDYYPQASGIQTAKGVPFNGTTGTGWGTLSNRPDACTAGVGYWATDTRTLYKCAATNTWTAYYTPYAYPHPLTQSGGTSAETAQPKVLTNGPALYTAYNVKGQVVATFNGQCAARETVSGFAQRERGLTNGLYVWVIRQGMIKQTVKRMVLR